MLLTATQIISSIVTMIHQIKEESENTGNHHNDDGIIDDDAKENGLEDDEDFGGFHENEDVTREADWRTMRILMGFTIMRVLPTRLKRPLWMC